MWARLHHYFTGCWTGPGGERTRVRFHVVPKGGHTQAPAPRDSSQKAAGMALAEGAGVRRRPSTQQGARILPKTFMTGRKNWYKKS